MWDIAKPFIDVDKMRSMGGRTPLMLATIVPMDTLKLGLLLANGDDILARDDGGRTCLDHCISSTTNMDFSEFESLVFLIQNGADVGSVDNSGESVSDWAYAYGSQDQEFSTGSYRGDLWDAVLSHCGYEVPQFRQCYHRVPRYTWRYTRAKFERLWEGREESCPYFHDPPNWCPDSFVGSECPLDGTHLYHLLETAAREGAERNTRGASSYQAQDSEDEELEEFYDIEAYEEEISEAELLEEIFDGEAAVEDQPVRR